MGGAIVGSVLSVVVVVCLVVIGYLLLHRRTSSASTQILSSIEQMREIGQLSVFKVLTKEIVTSEGHSWGDLGKNYFRWLLTTKKMAMIFEFDIDFRYDLRSDDFTISYPPGGECSITLPPCFHEVQIRDIRIYDEQKSRLFPLLLPDLVSGFFSGGFSEEDKNKLIQQAKAHAEGQARKMIDSLESEVQNSAKATLASIGRAFGVQNATFSYTSSRGHDMTVQVSEHVAQAA